MNKKQKVCLLGGIFAMVITLLITTGVDYYEWYMHASSILLLCTIAIVIITAGLIYIFEDKPNDKEKGETEGD